VFRQNLVSLGAPRFSGARRHEVSCTVELRFGVAVTRVRDTSEQKFPIVAHVISIYRNPRYATTNRGEPTPAIVYCSRLGHYAASGGNFLTTARCVIAQKKLVPSYFAAEA
jgi:hypothetical protein